MVRLGTAFIVLALAVSFRSAAHPASAGEVPDVRASFIETGFYHTCAVITDGGVQCWGDNGGGQLGDGTETDRPTPAPVIGLDAPIDIVALSDVHTCALSESGGVTCWGYNGEGQLGDGTGIDSPVPVQVDELDNGVSDLASGELHTCAVLDSGGVRCWGYGSLGQLGNGQTDDALSPVNVLNLENAVQIDGGEDDFTCVTEFAAAKCWGNNEDGHLGDGTTENRHAPIQVSGLTSNVDTVTAGGNHACALMANQTVRCWSQNFSGQLGNGAMDAGSLTPVQVHNIDEAIEITSGAFHSCALTTDRRVYCWGSNAAGQLGDGTNFSRDEPVLVDTLTDVIHIAGGYYHTCAVRKNGSVWCWGGNQSGQLGDGTFNPSNVPIEISLAEPPPGEKRTWGDDDCDDDVDSVDALKDLRFVAALSVVQEKDCPLFNTVVEVGEASPHPWGDVDCDEDVDSVDALKILRNVAALPVNQPKGCPEIGSGVTVAPG